MYVVCLSSPVAIHAQSVNAGAPDAAVVEEVRAAWKRRYEGTQTATYAATGTRQVAGPHNAGPTGSHKSDVNSSWLLDFDGNRLRMELRTEIFGVRKNRFVPRWKQSVFDGQTLRVHDAAVSANRGDHGKRQWEFAIYPGTEHYLEPYDCPVFLAHGVRCVFGVEAARVMKRPLHTERYVLHDRGVAKGRDCVIVRSLPGQAPPRVDEYWVDIERDGAIVRWRELHGESKKVCTKCEIEYQDTGHGWYPRGWRSDSYGSNGKLIHTDVVTVTEYNMNEAVDEGAFTLEPRPGMYLADNIKNRLFYVAADGSIVDPPKDEK